MKENRDKWIIKKKVKCDAMQYNIYSRRTTTHSNSTQANKSVFIIIKRCSKSAENEEKWEVLLNKLFSYFSLLDAKWTLVSEELSENVNLFINLRLFFHGNWIDFVNFYKNIREFQITRICYIILTKFIFETESVIKYWNNSFLNPNQF